MNKHHVKLQEPRGAAAPVPVRGSQPLQEGAHVRAEEVLAAVHALHRSQLGQRLLNLGEQVTDWHNPILGLTDPTGDLSSPPEGGRATRAHATWPGAPVTPLLSV